MKTYFVIYIVLKTAFDKTKYLLSRTYQDYMYKYILHLVYVFLTGVTHDLWLVGVFHAAFNIRSFEGEKFLVVSLNISICFEEAQPCYLSVQILRNTRLPRRLCSWETNYSIKSKVDFIV